MVNPSDPAHFHQPGEWCQRCRRLRTDGGCLAIAILDSPWAQFIAAPYANDPGQRRQRDLADNMQADTDAAEDYRRGAAEFCEAFRSDTSSPAKEGWGTLINLDTEGAK